MFLLFSVPSVYSVVNRSCSNCKLLIEMSPFGGGGRRRRTGEGHKSINERFILLYRIKNQEKSVWSFACHSCESTLIVYPESLGASAVADKESINVTMRQKNKQSKCSLDCHSCESRNPLT